MMYWLIGLEQLRVIGVRFAFVSGVFIGGVCCFLSGFLEYFPAGTSFVVVSIAIRVIHAAGNAGTITTTFTYTAVEFPDSVAKIFVRLLCSSSSYQISIRASHC